MDIIAIQIRRAASLRREVVAREARLYGPRFDDALFLRRRGFSVHVEPTKGRRRFRLGNRLVSGVELSRIARRERRLLEVARTSLPKGP
jgi:hypothetical protein